MDAVTLFPIPNCALYASSEQLFYRETQEGGGKIGKKESEEKEEQQQQEQGEEEEEREEREGREEEEEEEGDQMAVQEGEAQPEPLSVTEYQSPVHEPRRRAMVHPSAQAPVPKDYSE